MTTEYPLEGVKPRHDGIGPDLSTENLDALYGAAAVLTPDVDEQTALVVLCVSAGWDANKLRRRGLIGGVIPHRPPKAVHHVRHHTSKHVLEPKRRFR